MPTIYDSDPSELIEKASEELKRLESIKAPDWALFVKTGVHKERPPSTKDWWYVRTASVLRQIYRFGPIGVSKLRIKYGGKKNRGVKKEHFYKGSGSIIRKIIQQLEKEGFVKKDIKSIRKGRLITAQGKKFLDSIAGKISKVTVKEVPKTKEKPADKEVKQEKKDETKKETKQENKAEQKKENPVAKAKETTQKEAPTDNSNKK
jgi:small subunit ribosomal protein S19e|tara:strand:- start:1290 stop:1904 length:615 start_codon:yes stop_codon:yes gene_type:complete